MIWVDQTLNEGLRLNMYKGNIDRLIGVLQELQIEKMDCKVVEWQKYNQQLVNSFPRVEIRGKVDGTVAEVELAHQLGFTSILLSCRPASSKDCMEQSCVAILAAEKFSMHIALCIENASRFSGEELEGLWRRLPTTQVLTFVYGDGDSLLTPLSTFKRLSEVMARFSIPVEFHGHNAYGLATANALSAVQAGVKRIGVAVAGIGAQGHAALEELIMAQKCLFGEETQETRNLALLCREALDNLRVAVPGTKAIIGEDVFAHESGIHVDGVIKNPQLYESFSPDDVGLSRKIVIGKHSGTASILSKFKQWDVILTETEAHYLLKEVRKRAVFYKKSVDDEMLWGLYQSRVV